jgi:hypothetical protein
MTQTGKKIALAFVEGRSLTIKRTSVYANPSELWLHGSLIARTDAQGLVWMTLAGWPTSTTRDRLNALCDAYGVPSRFTQCKFEQFYGGLPINSHEWVPMAGPLAMQALLAERRLLAA